MAVIRHPEGGAGRVFWLSNERPNGPITFWRGNGGVDWEVAYVPAAQLRGAVEALATIRDLLGGTRVDQADVFAAYDRANDWLTANSGQS